jgi:hypothetical protein
MAELIAIVVFPPVSSGIALFRVKDFGEKRYIVSGKAILFQQCKAGDLVRFEGEWVSDRDRRVFRALSCEKIYSEKVIDVLGE